MWESDNLRWPSVHILHPFLVQVTAICVCRHLKHPLVQCPPGKVSPSMWTQTSENSHSYPLTSLDAGPPSAAVKLVICSVCTWLIQSWRTSVLDSYMAKRKWRVPCSPSKAPPLSGQPSLL
jgi:hypothetical protein